MTSISSNGKVAYIYDQPTQTWFPIAGTTNTAANYDWSGVHEFSNNPVTFNEVLHAQGGVNNFQNPNARDAAIPSAPDGLVCFIRQTNAGEQINQLQYYYNGVWKNLVGYSQVSAKLSDYTITALDAGKIITVDSSSSNTITIPANSSESIVPGYRLEVIQLGSGTTRIQPAVGVALKSKGRESLPATSPEAPLEFDSRYSKITLLKIDTNTWIAYGDIIESSSFIPYSFTPTSYTFTPTSYSFTPATPYAFTPATPYSFTPATPYSFTPAYTFTPTAYTFTPVAYTFTPTAYTFTPTAYTFTPVSYSFTPTATYSFTPTTTSNVEVPYVVGLTVELAQGLIYDAFLIPAPAIDYTTVGATVGNDGTVKSQNPAGGTMVPLGTNVQLEVYNYTPTYAFTPTTYTFTPTAYTFTPVSYSFTPTATYSFTPNSLCSDLSVLNQSQCAACGGVWDPIFGECSAGDTPPAYSFTPKTYSFTPTSYTFTPVAYSFTPATPYAFTPTAYSFTPNSLCSDLSVLNQSQCAACGGVWDPIFGECSAGDTPPAYSFTPKTYSFTPVAYSFTPYSFTPYSFTPYSFTPVAYTFTPATPYAFTPKTYSFTPTATYAFTPTATYSFTPTATYAFTPATPYAFTPATYSFTPTAGPVCRPACNPPYFCISTNTCAY